MPLFFLSPFPVSFPMFYSLLTSLIIPPFFLYLSTLLFPLTPRHLFSPPTSLSPNLPLLPLYSTSLLTPFLSPPFSLSPHLPLFPLYTNRIMRLWRHPHTLYHSEDRFKTGVMRRSSGGDFFSRAQDLAPMPLGEPPGLSAPPGSMPPHFVNPNPYVKPLGTYARYYFREP